MGQLMLLIAFEHILKRERTFESAADCPVSNGQQRPSTEVRKRRGKRQVGEEDGRSLGPEPLLERSCRVRR